MAPKKKLYKFHYGSQLPVTETRLQKTARLKFAKRTAAEVGRHLQEKHHRERGSDEHRDPEDSQAAPFETEPENEFNQLGFNDSSPWEDTEEIMDDEDAATLARIRSLHQQLIQQQQNRNWKDLTAEMHTVREMDLVDLMGQMRVKFTFCRCTPDPVHLLANGYLASTPIFPQTAFLLRLLNFYDLLWNICNSHVTPFAKVLQRWNESISVRLCAKKTSKLRRNLSASVGIYRTLKSMERNFFQTITSTNKQEILAQRSCPACFGVSHLVPNQPPSPDRNDQANTTNLTSNNTSPAQPLDSTNTTRSTDNTHTSNQVDIQTNTTNATSNSNSPVQPLHSTHTTRSPNHSNISNQAESQATNNPSRLDNNPNTQPQDDLNVPPDNCNMHPPEKNQVFVCLDGNFQHRHHERASKNYLELESQPFFIHPEELQLSNEEILHGELAKRVSKKAVRLSPPMLFSSYQY
ncbi:hypothetical protein PGTUg99_035927 [Puccinia graminis f. sp. tritici]|uniref:CxC1-like cysteine cluster associated with KDZ transposases domain-containing protein n=1 Tax=Puccinia graminis f. sp. tritici TaxID=56615 RepID=A0A5B0Q9F5_PUCGR|nr:hypothetical protein PGTUg99_035927 [Puccinia graminis f. sp. tritici]